MIAGALLRWRDRAARALAGRAHAADTGADSAALSVIGLQHARAALAASRPATLAQAAYRADALARIDSQIRARTDTHGAGVTARQHPRARDAAPGPCNGCAQVRHAFASVADAIAHALQPAKPGPMQRAIEAQQAAKPGPMQAAIDRFHVGAQ